MTFPDLLQALSQQRWRANVLALCCGMLTTLSFAPFYLSPLSLISSSLLFYLWLSNSSNNKDAFRHGFLFGFGLFATGIFWVYVSMSHYGGVPAPLAFLLTILIVLLLALFPAMAGYFYRRFFYTNTAGKLSIILLPTVWVLFEWIRGWAFFAGVPWLITGYSQINSPLIGFAPIIGVYGLSWIALVCSALLSYLFYNGKSAIKPGITVLLAIFISAAALDQIQWTNPKGEPLKVTLIQGNVSQDQKWLVKNRRPTIDFYTKLTKENWSSDLIIWPETAFPAYYHQAKKFLDELQQEARQNNTDILIGIPVMDDDKKRYYNGVISIGTNPGVYHKQHLVPFGEYIPFRELVGNVMKIFDVPLPSFSKSENKTRTLSIKNHQVGISICYEDAFGEEAILAIPSADLLVNVSNDAWFDDTTEPHQHLQIAQMRAIETGRPLLRATNTGATAIVDHKGKILSKLPLFKAQALNGTVQPMTGLTPYSRVGNWFIISMIILIMVGFLVYNRKKH